MDLGWKGETDWRVMKVIDWCGELRDKRKVEVRVVT